MRRGLGTVAVCFAWLTCLTAAPLEFRDIIPERSDAVLFNPGMGLYLAGGSMLKKGWDVRETVARGLSDPISYLNTNILPPQNWEKAPDQVKQIFLDDVQLELLEAP